jgi:hypothetical protein
VVFCFNLLKTSTIKNAVFAGLRLAEQQRKYLPATGDFLWLFFLFRSFLEMGLLRVAFP